VPKQETANSATVGPVKQMLTLLAGAPSGLGVAGPGADQIDFLHAVYGNFPDHPDRDPDVPAPRGRLPVGVAAGERPCS